MRPAIVLTLLLTLCQGAYGGWAAAGAVSGADDNGRFGIRLLDFPANRRNDPRALYQIVDHLAPGTTIHRRVLVTNQSAKALHIDMGSSAASVDNGKFVVAAPHTPNELTSWISFGRSSLDLPARSESAVQITIKVPGHASEKERYGIIWAQVTAPSDASHNLGVVAQVGIRVYLDVRAGGEPPSSFQIEQLTPARTKDGRPEVRAKVHNAGGRALDMGGTLTLSDGPGGLSAGPFAASPGTTLAPGESALVSVILDKRLPNGPWACQLTMSSGLIKRKVQANLTFPTAVDSTGETVRPGASPIRDGLLLLAAALIVPAAALATLIARRRSLGR